jgi:hypothetical protein
MDRSPIFYTLWERLLTSGHRTADPAAADFFYVPVSGRELKRQGLLLQALEYVAHAWPHWNRTQGRQHLLIAEGGSRGGAGAGAHSLRAAPGGWPCWGLALLVAAARGQRRSWQLLHPGARRRPPAALRPARPQATWGCASCPPP